MASLRHRLFVESSRGFFKIQETVYSTVLYRMRCLKLEVLAVSNRNSLINMLGTLSLRYLYYVIALYLGRKVCCPFRATLYCSVVL